MCVCVCVRVCVCVNVSVCIGSIDLVKSWRGEQHAALPASCPPPYRSPASATAGVFVLKIY